MDPDAIIDVPEGLKRGQVPVKGYLGKVNGEDVIVWIAQRAGGKRHAAGQIVTAFQPSSTQLYNYKMKHAFKVLRNPLSNQRYRAPEVPRVRANIPTRTPRAPRVTGAGKVTGFAGALVVDCAVSGGITGFMGGDAVEGCVDGLAGTEPVADGTVTGQEELDLGTALYHGKINNPLHPDHKLIDEEGKGLLDSRVNFRTSKILDGPYRGKCIAVKNGYTVAIECGSLAGHEKVGTPTERLLEKMGELAPPPPVYMPIPVVY